jgi:NTE family protein
VNTQIRTRVGLALGGGVVRGLAHVGVLQVMEEQGIPIDFIAGTSAGALIGAIYCAGLPIDQITAAALKMRWSSIASLTWPSHGFLSFSRMERKIIELVGDARFSDLQRPLTIVATRLDTGQSVDIRQGRLAPAVCASCAVPGFITPVQMDGSWLGDGSLVDTLPVSPSRAMGADYVIGVDIFNHRLRSRWWGPLGYGFLALEILVRNAGNGIQQADCLICPDLAGGTYLRFSQNRKLIELGRQAALEKIPEIKRRLNL